MALSHYRNPLFSGILFILTVAVLYWNSRLLPFIDLPNHLAEAVIFKQLMGNDPVFLDYYVKVPWYYPNTFHAYFASVFDSVEWGDRIYFTLYLLLLPLSVYILLRQVKGDMWIGLLSLLMVFNYNVTFGFVGYYMAIPLCLLFLSVLISMNERMRAFQMIVMALMLVLIYFMHAQAALFALLMLGLSHLVLYRKRPLQLWRTALIIIPVIALFIYWWTDRQTASEDSTLSYLLTYYSKEYFLGVIDRAGLFVLDFYHLGEKPWGFIFGICFSLVILSPIVLGRKNTGSMHPWLEHRKYILIFFVSAVLCFFLLPSKLPGQTPLFERFSTFVMLAAVLALSLLYRSAFLLRMVVLTALLAYLILWSGYLIEFNNVNKGFNQAFLREMPKDKVMYGLMYNNDFRGRPVYIHFPNYHTIWNKGPAASKIIDYRFGIVRRKPEGRKIPYYHEWIGDNYERIDYHPAAFILKHGQGPINDPNLSDLKRVSTKGDWELYQPKLLRKK